jgi:orotidine-5'-phosphate decarboxylase
MKLTSQEQEARSRVCLPLDKLPTMEAAYNRVHELSPVVGLYKIGKGSFTRFGHDIIEMVHSEDANIFLDLKYYDIPNTVEDAAAAAAELGVYMFNVHASGGVDMMKAAMEGAKKGADLAGVDMPKVIGVTVLTSFDEASYLRTFQPLNPELSKVDFGKYLSMDKDDEELQDEFERVLTHYDLNGVIQQQVLHLANLANEAGLDGIVCSAADLRDITEHLPTDFSYTTPGVKGPKTEAGKDQKRVMTPGNAIQDGSDILVVGRAITGGDTPEARIQAGYEVLQDMARYL